MRNPSTFTLNGTNCYLVGTGRRRLLVDAGEKYRGGKAFMDILDKCLKELGVEGLDGIVITHMHHDHYGNVGRRGLSRHVLPSPPLVFNEQMLQWIRPV